MLKKTVMTGWQMIKHILYDSNFLIKNHEKFNRA